MKRIELIAFLVLIAGMSFAGYLYESNKDEVSTMLLVPTIIGFLLVLYVIYHLFIRFFVKK
jgi:hypothetical protein